MKKYSQRRGVMPNHPVDNHRLSLIREMERLQEIVQARKEADASALFALSLLPAVLFLAYVLVH